MFAGGSSTNVGVSTTSGGSSASNSGASGGGVHAYSSALAEANDLDALVFEFGTCKCKFGYAGEDFPRVYDSFGQQQSANESHRRVAAMERNQEEIAQWMYDTAASTLQAKLSEHPLLFVERSFPIPEYVLASSSGSPSNDAAGSEDNTSTAASLRKSSMSSTSGGNSGSSSRKQLLKAREQLVEILMEQIEVPALFLAKSSVLTCYSNARTTGLVVEMGATYTSVTSVHEGFAFSTNAFGSTTGSNQPPPRSQFVVFGGYDLNTFLLNRLQTKMDLTGSTISNKTWCFASEVKESGLCRVADGAFEEEQNAQVPMINYELPDKTIVPMGTERFSVPERYFCPDGTKWSGFGPNPPIVEELDLTSATSSGVSGINLSELICGTASGNSEADLRKELYQNVILTGGSSCFENLPVRLEREMVATLTNSSMNSLNPGAAMASVPKVKVVAAHPHERKIGSFLGGSILASLGSFHEMWMAKAEYAEHGANLIHKKCP